ELVDGHNLVVDIETSLVCRCPSPDLRHEKPAVVIPCDGAERGSTRLSPHERLGRLESQADHVERIPQIEFTGTVQRRRPERLETGTSDRFDQRAELALFVSARARILREGRS